MKNQRKISIFTLTVSLVLGVVFCQRGISQAEVFSFFLGHRTWFSTGASDFTIGGVGGKPNIASELEWKNVDSTVAEFTGEALFFKTFFLTASIGFGGIGGGTLRDRDFEGDNRTDLLSDTESKADSEDLFYGSFDLGLRLLDWGRKGKKGGGSLDVLIGYQYWRETYVATKTVELFPGSGPIAEQGKALTEDFVWNSLRLGARGAIHFLDDLTFGVRFVVIPWTYYKLDDIHHLRTDLRQDPSFEARVGGGLGVQIDATLSYNIWVGLSLEAGYQYWRLQSGEGEITARSLTQGDVLEPFNEANSTRHGFLIGIHYRF